MLKLPAQEHLQLVLQNKKLKLGFCKRPSGRKLCVHAKVKRTGCDGQWNFRLAGCYDQGVRRTNFVRRIAR